MLEPRLVQRHPAMISDGGGLPFSPDGLVGASPPLDPEDPAVGALIRQINAQTAPKSSFQAPWKRDVGEHPVPPSLSNWRILARTEDEALFSLGRVPKLLTVAAKRDARRGTWKCVAVSTARPLRAARDGIRASSWRLDPTRDLGPEETMLRVLVTEQTFSGAQRADGRVLAPDLLVDGDELVLTMFVAPRPGFQARAPNPETPVRVALPQPVSTRQLVDGALYDPTVTALP